jgi:putative transposase
VKKKRRGARVSRHKSPLVARRHEALGQRIRELKAEHPFWGYRRIWAYLRVVEQRPVKKKRLVRLMRAPHLLVRPHLRLKAKRPPAGRKPKPTAPHEWWGIEMTTGLVQGCGWVSIVVVLDWYTKVIVGYYAGSQCTARHRLVALDMAVNRQCPAGVRASDLALMSDNGCQPTSTAFMRACGTLAIPQAFTSDNNPKGNADTERVRRTLKEECLWLSEWTCPWAVGEALSTWIQRYHEDYLHSALGDKAPRPFEREYHFSHGTQVPAA